MNKIIIGFIVSVVSFILFGFIFKFGWSIFIVPTFGVAYISLPVAMAIVHLITVPFAPYIMKHTIDQKMVGTDAATPMTRLLSYAFSIVIYAIITAIYYFILAWFM